MMREDKKRAINFRGIGSAGVSIKVPIALWPLRASALNSNPQSKMRTHSPSCLDENCKYTA